MNTAAAERTEDLAELELALLEALRWMRQTVHQAHHTGTIEACLRATCRHATRVLGDGGNGG